jgi:two-component system OmpR family sensor kinase
MADMTKLLNRTLKQFMVFAAIVLLVSVPVYYMIIARLWRYELDEHNIVLTDAAGREDTFMIIGAVTALTMTFFVLMMVGFILINRRISKNLWKPFYFSLGKIKNFNLDQQHNISFDKPDIDEFNELNQSLERLISGNIASYRQQKEFAENASHELQTPLSIIQSKLELLSQNSALQDDQYALIEDTLKALARVSRINKNLLLLTKIENNQYMDEESVNLSELLEKNLSMFSNFLDDKQLTLTKKIDPDIYVTGNKILIEILLNNLVTNSIRYSIEHGDIGISLTPCSIKISNPGAVSLKQDRLFKRFSTGSSESPGTGLGLALVKEICARYRWKENYLFENNNHIFLVSFKFLA